MQNRKSSAQPMAQRAQPHSTPSPPFHIPSTNTQNEVKFIQAVEKLTVSYINKSGSLIPSSHANIFQLYVTRKQRVKVTYALDML